jgi:hypothetical protein
MLDSISSAKTLRSQFRRTVVADIGELFVILKTQSRMSVFRRLREVGYRSSYTHAGRYYTLLDIPRFDERGLWFHQDVGFSRFGTLKSTLIALADTDQGASLTRRSREYCTCGSTIRSWSWYARGKWCETR